MMELQERGYGEVPEKYVCSNCFGDEGLKEFIANNGEQGICSYCDSNGDGNKLVVDLESIISHIIESISSEWRDAADSGTPYETREGGYQGPTCDTFDLLQDEEPIESEHQELFYDIVNTIYDTLWARPFSMPYDEMQIQEDWSRFIHAIKHRARFIIFHKSSDKIFENDYSWNFYNPKLAIDDIERTIHRLDLVTVLDNTISIYRARFSSENENFGTAKNMGTVPLKLAKQSNRMSPAGISMFYGAFNLETAKFEIGADAQAGYLHSAIFLPSRNLIVIDFTKVPYVPSIYSSNHTSRSDIRLMRDFVKDFSKPIDRNGHEHIDYIPTQVITEYLRYNYTYQGNRIDGIIYNSIHKTGKSCVLFIDAKHCKEKNEHLPDNELCLFLESYEIKKLS